MKKLSSWAKKHPTKARRFIILGHGLATYCAIQLGLLAYFNDFVLNPALHILFGALILFAIIIYPFKIKGRTKGKYATPRFRIALFLNVIGTYAMLCIFVNQFAFSGEQPVVENTPAKVLLIAKKADVSINKKPSKEEKKQFRASLKEFKTQIKAKLKSIKKVKKDQKKDDPDTVVAKVMLTILLTALVALGIAYFGCAISCGGGFAYVLGLMATIGLGVLGYRGIFKMGKTETPANG